MTGLRSGGSCKDLLEVLRRACMGGVVVVEVDARGEWIPPYWIVQRG